MTLSFADILSETRKYGLALFLTHQFTDQVDEDILKAILGNIGTLISFRIGARDAEVLKTEFHPVFNEIDLVNLPRYNIYLKLLIDGTTSQPFSAITLPSQPKTNPLREKVIEFSRKKYGRERALVEKSIFKNYQRPTKEGKEKGLFD